MNLFKKAKPDSLVEMFEKTIEYFENGKGKLSREEYTEAKVFLPDEVDEICSKEFETANNEKKCCFSVSNDDSYTAARKLAEKYKENRVLVLNFANPVNIGGGVEFGARAQEEDLCRKSSLFLSISGKDAENYYTYNRSLETFLGSDAIIISPNVEIIKDENGNMLENSVNVAVMTCAAPYIRDGLEGLTQQEYEEMFYSRIVKMLKIAYYLNYRVFVLGAWGCGAFYNDASLVSDLFYKAFGELEQNGINFRHIEFAILSRSKEQYNYKEFARNFENCSTDEKENRIKGCLIGGAVGDALGYAIEFYSENRIFAKYGESGITEYELDSYSNKALVSDDTQMSMFTANGVIVCDTIQAEQGITKKPREIVADSYLDWMFTQEHGYSEREKKESRVSWLLDVPEMFSQRAPGLTCMSALEDLKSKGKTENYLAYKRNNSKGCGGVMRVAPLGCRFDENIKKLDEEGAQLAAITHSNPLGYMPGAVLVHIIQRAVFDRKNDTLKDIVIDAINTVCGVFENDENTAVLKELINLAIELSENSDTDLNNIHRLGDGWVGDEALAMAIYCALRYHNDFSKGIIAAVNHKGDSDSTGAVTGNILGAWLGFDSIDDKWKKNLELFDVILELADDLSNGCSDGIDEKWKKKYIDMQR